jgi:hydroxymethylpyrimidine kinase/phosphomethylpyrimidine kinase
MGAMGPRRPPRRPAVVLTVAGSDPSGGAGIQADLKTFCAFRVYGEAAITSLTVQNTVGVRGVFPVPPGFVEEQVAAVLEDIPPGAIKTGMLATADLVEAVARAVARRGKAALVVDPVMVATSGARLLDADAVRAVVRRLLPLADVVTPNGPEAEVLTGVKVRDMASADEACRILLDMGARAAFVKGGHGTGPRVFDVLSWNDGVSTSHTMGFNHKRLRTRSTHGTGCTLSAALAAGLARGLSLGEAASNAVRFVHNAIKTAPGFGRGHGPVNHFVVPGTGSGE